RRDRQRMQPRSEAAVIEKRGSSAERRRALSGSTPVPTGKRVSSAARKDRAPSTPVRHAPTGKPGSSAARRDRVPLTPVRHAPTGKRGSSAAVHPRMPAADRAWRVCRTRHSRKISRTHKASRNRKANRAAGNIKKRKNKSNQFRLHFWQTRPEPKIGRVFFHASRYGSSCSDSN